MVFPAGPADAHVPSTDATTTPTAVEPPPPPMTPLVVAAYTATTALGRGNAAQREALRARRSGLVVHRATHDGGTLATWVGRIAALDAPSTDPDRPRNDRLAALALETDGFGDRARDAVARHGASRVALVLGTSTSTIAESERAYRGADPAASLAAQPALHHLHATTAFVQRRIGATGPCATVSTACSSSAKAFAQAARMIDLGLVDAAIVGGVDTLADSTLFGFHALGLVSSTRCRPFDAARDGISVGEGAGFALLERATAADDDRPRLVGYGESSDAYHQSSPHPDGDGARRAIEAALARAGLAADAVDHVNLHGTATAKNDAVEARLVARLFPPRVHAASTKGWTGHALGAAGIVEAVLTLLALADQRAPGTLGSTPGDADCGPQVRFDDAALRIDVALSHAFAFGGSNCVLAFARDRAAHERARATRR